MMNGKRLAHFSRNLTRNFISIWMPALRMIITSAAITSPRTKMAFSKIGGGHTVWCNPPYSNVKGWMRKCYYEGHRPNTTVVALVFAKTDTRWWWNYVQHKCEIRFVKGRLKFGGKDNAPYPSALLIWRGPEEDPQMTIRDI